MNRLTVFFTLVFLFLSGCSSQPPAATMTYKMPIKIELGDDINPYGDNTAHSVVLRLYQLTENGAFENSAFIDLYEKDRQLLGDSLVDVLYLEPQLPGRIIQQDFDIQQQTRYLAVLAEFADYGNAVGKGLVQLGEKPESAEMVIRVSGLRVSIEREPDQAWWKIF